MKANQKLLQVALPSRRRVLAAGCASILSLPLAFGEEKTAMDWLAEGDIADRELRTNDALKAYLQAEAAGLRSARLYNQLAKQYGESMVDCATEEEKLERGLQALDCAKKAVDAEAQNSDAHLSVAICYGRLLNLVGTKDKVEYSRKIKERADQAISLNPNSDYAWHMLGRWHRGVADIGGFQRGLARIIYGKIPKGTYQEAAEAFEKAEGLKPDRLAHPIELGITLAEMGNEEDARKALERGLALPDKERDDPDTRRRGKADLDALSKTKSN